MNITLDNIGKKYNNEWIFKDFSFSFSLGSSYAITGSNGSGKSTLINVISGYSPPSQGEITFKSNNKTIEIEHAYRYISTASPYLELIEEFTLKESLDFHQKFKPFIEGTSTKGLISILRLEQSKNKYIKNFSSGMKQRLKLGLAFYTDTPIILLDEPTSNLDTYNIDWYLQEVHKCLKDKLLIIGSNQPQEYDFCEKSIHLS